MEWDTFIRRCCVSFVQLLARDLAKSMYEGNREFIDKKLKELLKDDPFAIEIDKKSDFPGYM